MSGAETTAMTDASDATTTSLPIIDIVSSNALAGAVLLGLSLTYVIVIAVGIVLCVVVLVVVVCCVVRRRSAASSSSSSNGGAALQPRGVGAPTEQYNQLPDASARGPVYGTPAETLYTAPTTSLPPPPSPVHAEASSQQYLPLGAANAVPDAPQQYQPLPADAASGQYY